MNLLAIDTSTERMSVAVQKSGVVQPWLAEGAGAAAASSQLIASIQSLMQQADLRFAQLDAVVFGAGPGSFTGLRTACSVAQGLAYGAGVPVLPVGTLLAVAETARELLPDQAELRVTAALDARMDEIYVASFQWAEQRWREVSAPALIKPEVLALEAVSGSVLSALAGNVFETYGARLPEQAQVRVNAWPTGAALLRLAPALLHAGGAVAAQDAHPFYVRDKVAQTTMERQATWRAPL